MQHLSFVSQKHKVPHLSAIFDSISFRSSVTYIQTAQNTRKKLAEEEKRRVDNCHPNSQANSSGHCNVIVLLFMSIIFADPKDVTTIYISTFSNKYKERYK